MDLSPYVERLHTELASVAAAGGPDAAAASDRLLVALDSSVRLVLLQALADAAAEITSELDGASVDVRLRGAEPHLVVELGSVAPDDGAYEPQAADRDVDDDGPEATARLTVRLSERLKANAEAAAAAAGQSVNSWIVGAVRTALRSDGDDRWPPGPPRPPRGRPGRGQRRIQGWAR